MAQKNRDDMDINLGNYQLSDITERMCHEERSIFSAGYQNALHELEEMLKSTGTQTHFSPGSG
jgi:hypothetical protein